MLTGAKFEVAEAWMRMRHLPPALHEKIVSFYQDVWIQKQGAPHWRQIRTSLSCKADQ